MGFNIEAVEKYCRLNTFESSLLQSKEKPIVIVPINKSSNLPSEISPGRNTIGVMLAYTPLHLLLLEPEAGYPDLFVMTSGNVSEEPITFTNEDALDRLSEIADGFLLHDRDIHTRVDDTVITAVSSQPYFIRRSRGFAPQSIHLPGNREMGLAVGAELKDTFCFTKEDYAFVSHHIGDLKNYETYLAFTEGIDHYQRLFRIQPQTVACDMHPEYLSTRFAHSYAERNAIPLNEIQHHHAHLASCLADNGYFEKAPVIGIIFDGTGYGTDGNIWGGECLVGNAISYDRAYHLDYMPLPGGDHAVVNPSRIAIAYLIQNGINLDPALAPIQATEVAEIEILQKQILSHLNTPLTAGMGRLFDAVASLIGLRQFISYEAQAAIELEQIIEAGSQGMYPFQISENVIKIDTLLDAICNDLLANIPISIIAAKFHESVAQLVLDLANKIRKERGINSVALSGGVWQNEYLLIRSISLLESDGFTVFRHQQVPANDGGISFGQAAVINAANKESR
jgi:hydrogenase maturation protein HypF